MRMKLAALLGATAVVWAGLAAPAYAADSVKLSVLHEVPGLTVDVYVNGERTIDNFKPGTLAGPLNLDAGSYEVAITAADADDDSDPAIGPVDLDLKAGGNYTAVAHLDEGGDPDGNPVHQRHEQDRRRPGPADRPTHRRGARRGHPGRGRRRDQRPVQPGREGAEPGCRHRGGLGCGRPARPT